MDRIILHIDVNNAFLSWTAVYMLKKGYKYDIRNRYAVMSHREEVLFLLKVILVKRRG